MVKLAVRLSEDNPKSIVLQLNEPFNTTQIASESHHVIQSEFTWSLQTMNSIKTTNSYASYQIIPVEITTLLLSHLKSEMYLFLFCIILLMK